MEKLFLFNFYSNTDLYILIFLSGLILSVILFGLSVMFDSKRIFFLFLSASFSAILLNINVIPTDIIVLLFLINFYLSKDLKGGIKHKIALNIASGIIVFFVTISGTFSIIHFIDNGDKSKQTFLKQEILHKL